MGLGHASIAKRFGFAGNTLHIHWDLRGSPVALAAPNVSHRLRSATTASRGARGVRSAAPSVGCV